jgi:hypothetical protein
MLLDAGSEVIESLLEPGEPFLDSIDLTSIVVSTELFDPGSEVHMVGIMLINSTIAKPSDKSSNQPSSDTATEEPRDDRQDRR